MTNSSKRTDQILEIAIQNQINHQQRLNAIAEKHVSTLLSKGSHDEAMKIMQFFNNEAARNISTFLQLKNTHGSGDDTALQQLGRILNQPGPLERLAEERTRPEKKTTRKNKDQSVDTDAGSIFDKLV